MKTILITVLFALGASAAQAATIVDPVGGVSGAAIIGERVRDFSADGVPSFADAQLEAGDRFAYAFGAVESGALEAGAEVIGGSGSGTASFTGTITGSARLYISFESIILGLGPVTTSTELAFSVVQDGLTFIEEQFTFDRSDTLFYAALLDLGDDTAEFAISITGAAAAGALGYATSVAVASFELAPVPLPAAIYGLLAALASFVPFARRRVAGV